MSKLLQCIRPDGKFVNIVGWEKEMEDDKKWGNSPQQKIFFNFRISEAQETRLNKLNETKIISWNKDILKDNPAYKDFSTQLENNTILNIENIPNWEDFIKKEDRPIESVEVE